MSRQVRDPEREDGWQSFGVHNDREAVQLFLSDNDPRLFNVGDAVWIAMCPRRPLARERRRVQP